MPELPDVLIYVEKLRERLIGRPVRRVRVMGPFLVRTVDPPIEALEGATVQDVQRMGKQIVIRFDAQVILVVHLMIAGRFRWLPPAGKPPARITQAVFEFDHGTLAITEAGKKKRAYLHVLRGEEALGDLDRGGLNVLETDAAAFRSALVRENHTLKRSLTDPRLFDGIGNAYSDEILHAARLPPTALTQRLQSDEIDRLHEAAKRVLTHWIARLRVTFEGRFPRAGEITAFRDGFAVHGRY
ncbi:MAG: DNA-formamidopyrimidine glycosylase family protein, partial [Phycisphaerae bacterium]